MAGLIPLTRKVAQSAADTFQGTAEARNSLDRGRLPDAPANANPKQRILSVSDLHVGMGVCPLTGRMDPTEDWRPAQQLQFFQFLLRQWQEMAHPDDRGALVASADATGERWSPQGGVKHPPQTPITLNLNGDILELMQATQPRAGHGFVDGFEGGGPRTTPANTLAKLDLIHEGHPAFFRTLALHLALGHRMDVLPGNHDRDLANKWVWEGGVDREGRVYRGFRGIIQHELEGLGLGPVEVNQALERMRNLPFAVYGDTWYDHGHHEDPFNRTRRPLKEYLDPSPMHQEMPQAFGDYGVRDGYDALERRLPNLTENHHAVTDFLPAMVRAPRSLLGLVKGFAKAAGRERDGQSAHADEAQRRIDAGRVAQLLPELTQMLNQFRPEGEQLSLDQVKEGLQQVEGATATPLYSMMESGAYLFERMGVLMKAKKVTHQSQREKKLDVLFETFGVSNLVQGHTHAPADENFVNRDGHRLRYQNTHTWTDGKAMSSEPAFKQGGRAVHILDLGVDAHGRPWSRGRLGVVTDGSGRIQPASLREAGQEVSEAEARRAHLIFQKSLRGRNRPGPAWKKPPPQWAPERVKGGK